MAKKRDKWQIKSEANYKAKTRRFQLTFRLDIEEDVELLKWLEEQAESIDCTVPATVKEILHMLKEQT